MNSPNVRGRDAVLAPERRERLTCGYPLPDADHIGFIKNGRPRPCSAMHPPLPNSVSRVFKLSSDTKMSDVAARWIIATVEDYLPFWNWAIFDFPRGAVGAPGLTAISKLPVAAANVFGASPLEATGGRQRSIIADYALLRAITGLWSRWNKWVAAISAWLRLLPHSNNRNHSQIIRVGLSHVN